MLQAAATEELGVVRALLPLLAPDVSWVIQGRCCGVLSLLARQELRHQVPSGILSASSAYLRDAPLA